MMESLRGMLPGVAPAQSSTVVPKGELAKRIEMACDRMRHGQVPAFTKEFILSDIVLDPVHPRRFDNYSGDLSGRYLGAFAAMPEPDGGAGILDLAFEGVAHQRSDGRFGSDALRFVPEEMGLDHMALLWGNGRLLVGLIEVYALKSDPRLLESARKLGDFLLTVHDACANEETIARVESLGAAGMICFSQLIEPFVMLTRATGDVRYLDGAEKILPWFPQERGTQHSHGYLTTLRGILLFHEVTANPGPLALVRHLFDDLLASPDCRVFGGVQEYFGGKGDRDEGCSEADFVRVGLELWRMTGEMKYLDAAERCFYNQFCANQFPSGDFGHQFHFSDGFGATQGVGRAWWCCTMHAYRAFRDVLDVIVTRRADQVRLNLFLDAEWSDGDAALTIETRPASTAPYCVVTVRRAPDTGLQLAIRRPVWAQTMALALNGNAIDAKGKDGYQTPVKPLRTGDRLEIAVDFRLRFVNPDGTGLDSSAFLAGPVRAALFRGPWLLGVDEAEDLMFYGEPWQENVISLAGQTVAADPSNDPIEIPNAHVRARYVHGGFPGVHPLELRPVSEKTRHEPMMFAVWLDYRGAFGH